MTSLDGINGWSIQMLLRGENDLKQSDEIRATFLSSPYAWKRIVLIGSECSPVNQSMGEFQVTEHIFSTKQNQNIKEALTGTLLNLNIRQENRAIVLSLNRKWPFTVFFIGEMLWQFCQEVLARA